MTELLEKTENTEKADNSLQSADRDFTIVCENVACCFTIRQGHRMPLYYSAIKDVSFSLRPGDRLGIIGVNGAGKSTLLKIVAGLLFPTSGQVRRKGNPRCNLLNLNNNRYPDLSGRENAVLTCLFGGLRRHEAEERLPEIIDFSELGDWIDQPLRTYSSGMSARLGVAIALQMKPDVLLLDETLSVGDAGFRDKAANAIQAKMEEVRSVVLVSHEINALRSICDRLLWLENGLLRAEGPTDEILDEYQAALRPASRT